MCVVDNGWVGILIQNPFVHEFVNESAFGVNVVVVKYGVFAFIIGHVLGQFAGLGFVVKVQD